MRQLTGHPTNFPMHHVHHCRAALRGAAAWAAAFALCLGAAWGCTPSPADSSTPASQLPEFTSAEATLFDDTIGLGAFGAELEEVSPSADPKLRDRTNRADLVAPVSVSTVTRDSGGSVESYTIAVTEAGEPFVGNMGPYPIELTVNDNSPSFPFVRSADAGLMGKKLILFLKYYSEGGKAVTHWRLETDSDEIRKAISDTRALEEIGR